MERFCLSKGNSTLYLGYLIVLLLLDAVGKKIYHELLSELVSVPHKPGNKTKTDLIVLL